MVFGGAGKKIFLLQEKMLKCPHISFLFIIKSNDVVLHMCPVE